MTNLTIDRLGADVPDTAGSDAAARVDALLRDLADRRLAERIGTLAVGDGEWCIGRLDVTLELDPARPDPGIADRWADQLLAALVGAVADGTSAVHYRHRGAALKDLVCCLAAGRTERVWAWRLLGLLQVADPDPGDHPGRGALAALGRAPQEALSATLAAAEAVGVEALHRLLGPGGWVELARILQPAWDPSTSGSMSAARSDRPGTMAGVGSGSGSGSDRSSFGPPPSPAPARAQRSGRAGAYWRDSRFAAACRRSSVRPDPAVATAWAVIALTELEPRGPVWASRDVIDRLAEEFTDPATASTARRPAEQDAPGAGRPGRLAVRPADDGVRTGPAAAEPTDPATFVPSETRRVDAGPPHSDPNMGGTARSSEEPRPAAREQLPTQREPIGAKEPVTTEQEVEPEAYATAWAGLPYLLNTAETAGIPDQPRDDPRLSGRTLRWILHQIALRLAPIRADDPAALVMAGLTPDTDLPSGPDADRDEDAALIEHALRWAEVTRRRLADADGDEGPDSIWWLARRPGEIVADPGWLEVRLGLDQVEVPIRRAGLDLDPGWLGWLGAVVRFRYV